MECQVIGSSKIAKDILLGDEVRHDHLMAGQEGMLRNALTNFLRKHSADESINGIDDIVLSYMVGVLEELGSEDIAGDAFDLDGFIEMMDAYLPGFSNVNSMLVCEWMFELAAQLRELNNSGKSKTSLTQLFTAPISPPADKPDSISTKVTLTSKSSSSKGHQKEGKGGRRSRKSSEKMEVERGAEASHVECQNGHYENSESVKLLQEMFPSACTLEVSHCLDVSNGDLESAAQLILARQETGESYSAVATKVKAHRTSAKKQALSDVEDSKLKKSIISKYSYVDLDESKKEHRPVMPKYDDKKLTRYLDNKVVSTKGERFTEIKTDQDEVVKKTTVNLKPAKQYRFH